MNKENDIIYTAQDIDAYLSGRLTALQMHAMEKAALDDSFLAEAMEGYASVNNEDWATQLAAVKKNFEQQEEKDNKAVIVPMHKRNNNWWKIAAAVILLVGTATFSYLALNKKDKPAIAQEVKVKQQNTAPVLPDSLPPAANTNAVAENTLVSSSKNNGTNVTTNANATEVVKDTARGEELVAFERKKLTDGDVVAPNEKATIPSKRLDAVADLKKTEIKQQEDFAKTATPPAAPTVGYSNSGIVNNNTATNNRKDALEKKADGFAMQKAKETVPLNHNFMGQVLAPDNTPLPFANISIKKENFGTYADVKGNFSLISTDSLLTVEVKAAGYQPKFYTLQSFMQQNKIVLAEDKSAFKYNPVVADKNETVARTKTSRRATLVKDSVVNVEPADGWENYDTYVNNNIEIPDDILTKNIHGQVELSFDVKANGAITNIKVDKSLCDNCDEVAKRLLQQGPQWKLKKGKKGKGKVTVQF